MYRRRLAAIAAAATALLVATTGPAAASELIEITGARGYYDGRSNITVYDTLCDDDSVYADWQTLGGGNGRIRNNQGCGTHVTQPAGGGAIRWRICVDKSWPTSDYCSAWT